MTTARISVRVTKSEKDKIKKNAKRYGATSLSEWVRFQLLGKK